MLSSPLEQFDVFYLIPFYLGSLHLSFTNSSLFMVLSFISLFFIILQSLSLQSIIPNRWKLAIESLYGFVYDLAISNLGSKGKYYFPFLLTVFLTILIFNVIGMIPYSFTVTSHIIATFGLSLTIWLGTVILGFMNHGIKFLGMFMPEGAPIALAPLLVVIELISFTSRALSLGIRLFANMMAGHTLFKILIGFAWIMIFDINNVIINLVGFFPIILLFVLTFLEFGVALLQAYVFTILTAMYINDSINLH